VQYEKGKEIRGLENFKDRDGYLLFHSGTAVKDGKVVSNGGRVLGVTALGKDIHEARVKAYEAISWVDFDNKYFRTDIARSADTL
jgi:phosphoribosylamine--glycine ligase